MELLIALILVAIGGFVGFYAGRAAPLVDRANAARDYLRKNPPPLEGIPEDQRVKFEVWLSA